MSSRTVQDLGFAFRGFADAKAPFNCSSGSEGTNNNLLELVPPRSPPRSASRGRRFPQSGPKGAGHEIRGGLTPNGGEGYAHGARGLLSCEPPGSSPLVAQ